MKIAETNNRKHLKTCAFPGCTNKFKGISNRKYCRDERCKQLRKEAMAAKPRTCYKDPDADNIVLNKRAAAKLKKGRVLIMRCRAKNAEGNRCTNKFTTVYEPQCSIYPKFCEQHRTAYRRKRFSLKKGKDG